jgi:glycosyltransferase involved in cell wall biosynthesis
MRIAVDARAAAAAPTGISCYVRTLVSALAACPGDHRYLLLREGESSLPLSTDARFTEVGVGAADTWMEFNLDGLLDDWGAELYHSPLAPPPVVCPCPRVLTVHDVIPRLWPDLVDEGFWHYFTERIVPAFRQGEHLIAVSHCTGRDLAHLYGLGPERMSVVPEAPLPEHVRAVPEPQARTIVASLGVRQPYLLYVGAIEPRKNVAVLLQAFEVLRAKGSVAPQLVVVGDARGEAARPLLRQLEGAQQRGPVIWLRAVAAQELCALYQLASCFVFLSRYEGFGLPVLEAMSHGLPVVVSRVSSLPEVVGEAGLLVDPHDEKAAAAALHELLTDPCLRRSLAQRARERAAEFGLSAMGEGTLAAYRRAMEAPVRHD